MLHEIERDLKNHGERKTEGNKKKAESKRKKIAIRRKQGLISS